MTPSLSPDLATAPCAVIANHLDELRTCINDLVLRLGGSRWQMSVAHQDDRPVELRDGRLGQRAGSCVESFGGGSLAKLLTAVAVSQLEAESPGLLDVSLVAAGIIDAPGARVSEDLTLRHCLSARGGLEHGVAAFAHLDLQHAVAAIIERRPIFPPGATVSVSNSEFVIGAAAVERLTGRPWCDVVQERVIDTFGLTASRLRRQAVDGSAQSRGAGVLEVVGGDFRTTASDLALLGAQLMPWLAQREGTRPEGNALWINGSPMPSGTYEGLRVGPGIGFLGSSNDVLGFVGFSGTDSVTLRICKRCGAAMALCVDAPGADIVVSDTMAHYRLSDTDSANAKRAGVTIQPNPSQASTRYWNGGLVELAPRGAEWMTARVQRGSRGVALHHLRRTDDPTVLLRPARKGGFRLVRSWPAGHAGPRAILHLEGMAYAAIDQGS